jgi:hypothetical protein
MRRALPPCPRPPPWRLRCRHPLRPPHRPPAAPSVAPAPTKLPWSASDAAFLDTLQVRTFHFFWDLSDRRTGLSPDRAPTRSFASVSATGFALTAYCIGAERGWVTRAAAARRTLDTLRFFVTAPMDSTPRATGYRGFYYHFLDPESGRRFEDVELSTVDTALLLAGVLCGQSYFDAATAVEDSIRACADTLVARADWRWAQPRGPALVHGWDPENGFLPYDWRGYNEAMLLPILALGATRHAPTGDVWGTWSGTYKWGSYYGHAHLGFAPLFGHQYSHVWIDFRGIHDAPMRAHDLDYFENSRRAVLSQRAYAIENPGGWRGYGPQGWGLSACDGPVDGTYGIEGRKREFHTYWARGASFTNVDDDGTLSPSAVGGSVAFAPEIAVPTLRALRVTYGDALFGTYGFLDAFNPTFQLDVPVYHGKVVPGVGWFDTDYLGIDQGPILAMIENARSGFVWRVMQRNPHVVRGLRAAGFTGGWLGS